MLNSLRLAIDGPDRSNVYLKLALGVSVAAHAVLLSVKFVYPELKKLSSTVPLDVILVNSKSADQPLDPQALAQANLDGGGNTDENRRIKTPLPMQKNAETAQEHELEEATKRQQQLEAEAQKLMETTKSKLQMPAADAKTAPEPQPNSGQDTQDLVQKSLAMARLEGQISKDWDAYQQRPRKMFIGARVKGVGYARYMDDWRIKIERTGANLYPEAAKRNKIYGSLQLSVEVRSDGTIANVEINRSSGHKILDEAALRIVRQAAPFPQFPPEIRKDYEILSITRTWTFTTSDKLESKD